MMDKRDYSQLPAVLPCPSFEARWIEDFSQWEGLVNAEAQRVSAAPGWNPKVINLEGTLVMVDLAFEPNSDSVHAIKVVDYVDHPFRSALPSNAPKAVKAIYLATNRMKYLRSAESWSYFQDTDRADAAWGKYLGLDRSENHDDFFAAHPNAIIAHRESGPVVEVYRNG